MLFRPDVEPNGYLNHPRRSLVSDRTDQNTPLWIGSVLSREQIRVVLYPAVFRPSWQSLPCGARQYATDLRDRTLLVYLFEAVNHDRRILNRLVLRRQQITQLRIVVNHHVNELIGLIGIDYLVIHELLDILSELTKLL